MRTSIIIALALTAALFGYYLLHDEPAARDSLPAESLSSVRQGQDQHANPTPPATAEGSDLEATAESQLGCTPATHYAANADGTTTELLTCDRQVAPPRHDYEDYPSNSLDDLAWSDALAAEVLGMRLREENAALSLSLILRASALSGGDPAPILAWSNAYPRPTRIDGALVRETVHTRFVLAAVAEMLGAGPNLLPYWEAQIRQASTDPEREIQLLRDRARRVLDEMRQIELEVTGSSTFGGQSDA